MTPDRFAPSSGPDRPGTGPDDDLAELLRATAQAHQPDVEAMLRHVRQHTTDPRTTPSSSRKRIPRLPTHLTGWALTGLAAAAVATVLVLTTTLLTPTDPTPAPPAGPTTTATSAQAPMVRATMVPTGASEGRLVQLSDPQTRDWVVGGVDPSAPQTWAREQVDEQLLEFSAAGGATSSLGEGVFDVRFDGGTEPYVSGRVDRRWWESQGADDTVQSGWTVRVAPATGRQDLTVWAGVGDQDGRLALVVDDEVVYTLTLPGQDDAPSGYVLSVPLDLVDDAVAVELRLTSPTGGPIAFAAASLL